MDKSPAIHSSLGVPSVEVQLGIDALSVGAIPEDAGKQIFDAHCRHLEDLGYNDAVERANRELISEFEGIAEADRTPGQQARVTIVKDARAAAIASFKNQRPGEFVTGQLVRHSSGRRNNSLPLGAARPLGAEANASDQPTINAALQERERRAGVARYANEKINRANIKHANLSRKWGRV